MPNETTEVIIGGYAVTPPLLWEEINHGEEYFVIDTSDAGDWVVKTITVDKQNSYYQQLAQSARIFESANKASEFIHALESLGGKNGETTK